MKIKIKREGGCDPGKGKDPGKEKGQEPKEPRGKCRIRKGALTQRSLEDKTAYWSVMNLTVIKSLVCPKGRPIAMSHNLSRRSTTPSSFRDGGTPSGVRSKGRDIHTGEKHDLPDPP